MRNMKMGDMKIRERGNMEHQHNLHSKNIAIVKCIVMYCTLSGEIGATRKQF